MSLKQLWGAAIALMGLALAWAGPAAAEEGMWTFDNFPAAAVQKAYGVTIDQSWLDHVRQSSARLSSGCSASVVSGRGLTMTNYHCVVDCVQSLSTPTSDLVQSGFETTGLAGERLCPGMQADILESMTDVTAKVEASVAGLSPDQSVRAHDAAIAGIEASCGPDRAVHCQVIGLYHGGQYVLYRYHRYADVRLVFAPEFKIAFFGGDPDNFNFPRYDLDVGFLRLYENGEPAVTAAHFAWTSAPPRAGDPVFVAGNPGGTERQLTVSQLETQRDVVLPLSELQRAEERGRIIRFREESAEHSRVAADPLFSLENSYKAIYGRMLTLNDPAFMNAKRKDEAQFKAMLAAQPTLKGHAGDPWADTAAIQTAYANLYLPYRQIEAAAGSNSDLFSYARLLVRAASERQKPSGQRLRDYADARLPALEKGLLDARPIDPELERLYLEFWLSKTREVLTADDPNVATLLGKESPEGLAARLVAGTRLADPAVRRALWDGGQKAIDASDDPLIRYVAQIDPLARTLRADWERRVTGPTDEASTRLARIRFALYGKSVYPDATFSLRLSYGQIAGWTERERPIDPFTHFGGLFTRATGQDPFDLPPRWVGAKDRLDPRTVFDISTTNDIIGGNSGSPLINAKGQVIGAVFDGNIHSLGGDYGYDGTLNRAVAVSTTAITEALTRIYGQDRIVAELQGR